MGDSDGFSTLMHASLIEIFGQRDGTRRRDAMRRTYAVRGIDIAAIANGRIASLQTLLAA